MMNRQKEKEIVNNIIKKDVKTLLDFYRQYQRPVFNFIFRQTKDQFLSEELTQDVFLEFIEALRDFRYQASLKTFLFSIAKNKTIDWIRKKKIKKILFSALPSYVVEGLKFVLMDEEIEKKFLTKKIAKVFKTLPNDYRFILRQKYLDGERVTEIAEKLQLGFKATESLLFRARQAFIKAFKTLPWKLLTYA